MAAIFRRVALTLAVALALPAAARTQETLGTLAAELDGEARTWAVVGLGDGAPGAVATYWRSFMGEVDRLWIGALPDPADAGHGALTLVLRNRGGFPEGCPCTFSGVEIVYRPDPEGAEPPYRTAAGEVTIAAVREAVGEALRIEGDVAGTLERGGDAIEIRGTFAVDAVPKLD